MLLLLEEALKYMATLAFGACTCNVMLLFYTYNLQRGPWWSLVPVEPGNREESTQTETVMLNV